MHTSFSIAMYACTCVLGVCVYGCMHAWLTLQRLIHIETSSFLAVVSAGLLMVVVLCRQTWKQRCLNAIELDKRLLGGQAPEPTVAPLVAGGRTWDMPGLRKEDPDRRSRCTRRCGLIPRARLLSGTERKKQRNTEDRLYARSPKT